MFSGSWDVFIIGFLPDVPNRVSFAFSVSDMQTSP